MGGGSLADAGGVYSMTLCRDLAGVRGAVFLRTKKQVLHTVLERTVTRPKKADDEYDYPDDLPQLELNRPKVRADREREREGGGESM